MKTITKLLGLPDFEAMKVLEHHNESPHLYIDMKETGAPVCSACAAVHKAPVHSIGLIRVEDRPLNGKRTFLYVPKRKVLCPNDGKIWVEHLISSGGGLTPDRESPGMEMT